MGILRLYISTSAGLYGSEVEDIINVGREVVGKWRSSWDNWLLKAALLTLEDTASRKEGWGKESLPVWFRIHRSDEGKQRGGGGMG